MSYVQFAETFLTSTGVPSVGASITVRDIDSANATVSSPLAAIYSDESGTGASNPASTDSSGFVKFFLTKSKRYEITATGGTPSMGTRVYRVDALATGLQSDSHTSAATLDHPDGSVTSAKIADGTIATADLADGSVTSAKVADGTIATADLANDSVTSAKIADSTIATADLAAVPTVRVYNSVSLTAVPSGSWYAIPFDSERWDTDSMHSTSSDTTRLTATTAGVYAVTGHVTWDTNTTGARGLAITLNGVYYALNQMQPYPLLNWQTVATVLKMSAGQYVELHAYQDSGANRTISALSAYSPEFAACWIGK